jgi:diguanylate cyclase (GGDEF)-like protein
MDEPIRILILEDSADDAELLQHEIRKAGIRFEGLVVDTRAGFLKALSAFAPDIILADNELPQINGSTALRLARKARPKTPFILVTGSIPDEQAAEMLASGASDYILKDRRSRLAPAIRRALKEAEERALRSRAEETVRQTEEQIARSALLDALTGLSNRRFLMERLDRALRVAHCGGGFALLLVDLDHFKDVNDSLGHEAGDRFLVSIAERLRDVARPQDTVARLGGDEFAILLEAIGDVSEAIGVAQRIQQRLLAPVALDGNEVVAPVSIGFVLGPSDYHSPGDLLRDADTALYRAKELGRARVEGFDPSMRERVQTVLRTQSDLRQALARREFRVLYQPIVWLGSNVLVSCEALVRWDHPRRGLVPPAEFIPIAEETGAIVQIGEWVLREACAQARAWDDLGPAPPSVAVNLSARQFREQGLSRMVERILQETGLPPARLKLEVTESALMYDVAKAASIVRELRGLGVGFALDDFGTGHSSLSYVKHFPLSDLKIDRSFVSDITTTTEAAAIATAVVNLGHSLDLTVIAEGIETEAQRLFLEDLRCDAGQGYHLGRPMPGQSLEDLLRANRLRSHGQAPSFPFPQHQADRRKQQKA